MLECGSRARAFSAAAEPQTASIRWRLADLSLIPIVLSEVITLRDNAREFAHQPQPILTCILPVKLAMSSAGIASVDRLTTSLRKLLERPNELKPDGGIEPALTSTNFGGDVETIIRRAEGGITANAQDHYAALETACRNIFYDLLVGSMYLQNRQHS